MYMGQRKEHLSPLMCESQEYVSVTCISGRWHNYI